MMSHGIGTVLHSTTKRCPENLWKLAVYNPTSDAPLLESELQADRGAALIGERGTRESKRNRRCRMLCVLPGAGSRDAPHDAQREAGGNPARIKKKSRSVKYRKIGSSLTVNQ